MKNNSKWLFPKIFGKYEAVFASPHPERIIDFCLMSNIPIKNVTKNGDKICFTVAAGYKDNVSVFRNYGLKKEESLEFYRIGILRKIHAYRKRLGIPAGLILLAVSVILSTRYIWSVDISGNAAVPEKEIREVLKSVGIYEGRRISDINKNEAALLFEINDPRFSFASVNLIGTRAVVTLREGDFPEKNEEQKNAVNLVAKTSGRIVRFEVTNGQLMVKRDDFVEKGDLLISGIVEKKTGSFYTTAAGGRVFAETERVFETSIPLEETVKEYTGNEKEFTEYYILGKKVARKGSPEPGFDSFETAESEEYIYVLGKKLPILSKKKTYLEYAEKTNLIDVDRASDLAYDMYKRYMVSSLAEDSKIVSEKTYTEQKDGYLTFTAIATVIEDICEEKEFYLIP